MTISICNFASIHDRDVERVCAAIDRQIATQFATHWNFESRVRLLGSRSEPRGGAAIIYLWDRVADVPIALVDEDPRGLPFGLVIVEISEQLEEPWSVTLTREALALIGDTQISLAAGRSAADPSGIVCRWFEMCDAVEAETMERGGDGASAPPSSSAADVERVQKGLLHKRPPGGALRAFGGDRGRRVAPSRIDPTDGLDR